MDNEEGTCETEPSYLITQRKLPKFHLIFRCQIFVEMHSFCRVSDEIYTLQYPKNVLEACTKAHAQTQQKKP